jgi:hypothetical protein
MKTYAALLIVLSLAAPTVAPAAAQKGVLGTRGTVNSRLRRALDRLRPVIEEGAE